MKKILTFMLSLCLLLTMAPAAFAATPAQTKTAVIKDDYNGDGIVDFQYTVSKVLGTKTDKMVKVTPEANAFTSVMLTHPGGDVKFYVVQEGSEIDLSGSAYTMGHWTNLIYKMKKGSDGNFQPASFTQVPYQRSDDPIKDMKARDAAGLVEYKEVITSETEKTVGGVQWMVRGGGSKLTLEKEGYYILNVLGPKKEALKTKLPTDITSSVLTDQALIECCLFIRVVKAA